MSLSDYKSFVEDVRHKNPLKDIVAEDAELVRSGKGYKCKSPLRSESDPSFFVYEDGSWYDFGLSEGGDVFEYVQKKFGCTFNEAVNKLAERAGISIRRAEHMDADVKEFVENTVERRYIYKILTIAAHHYHRKMPADIRERIKTQYGFTDETIDQFCIGWADGNLREFLKKEHGFDEEKLLKTGLFIKFDNGNFVDFFDKRIMFPYWKNGQVAYFIGRRIDGITSEADHEKAKYKKQLTFQKHDYVSEYITNDVFYGEDSMKPGHDVIITEGVTDCISAIQAGFCCISPVTVRFKKADHPRLIELTSKANIIYVCNDEEEAKVNPHTGREMKVAIEGAMETVQALFEAGRAVRLVRLPKLPDETKVDLNSYLKQYGVEGFAGVLLDSKAYPRLVIDSVPKDIQPEQIDEELGPIYDVLCACRPVQRDQYIDEIAKKYKVKKTTILKEISKRTKNATDETLDDGWNRVGKIEEDIDKSVYYFPSKDGNAIISSFRLEPSEKLITDFGEVIRTKVFTERGEIIEGADFHVSSWRTRRDFVINMLKISTNLQWVGNDDHVQGLLRMISGIPMPKYRGTDMLGYYEDKDGPRWVTKDMVIAPDGVMTEPNIKYTSSGMSLENRVSYEFPEEQELKALANQVIPLLMETNEPEVMVPLVGWFVASLVTPIVRAVTGTFPILWVWGSAGSGKTTVIKELMWPLTGVCKNRDMFSATDTGFTQMRTCASTTSIPICIDEYRRDMGKNKRDQCHRLARRVYNGESEQRGRSDQSVSFYRLIAPLCFIGEMLPNDTAILERIVCVVPDKNALTPERQAAFNKVTRLPIYRLAGPLVKFAMSRSVISDLSVVKKFVDKVLTELGAQDISARPRSNLVTMALGYYIWEEFANSLGVQVPSFDEKKIFKKLIENASRSEAGISSSVRDAADNFVSDLSTYAGLGLLQEGTHYAILAQKEGNQLVKKIYIRLKLCYEVYLREKKNSGQEDETNGYDSLKLIIKQKMQRGKSYFFDRGHRVKFGETQYSCIGINPDLVPKDLDFEIFPHNNARTWGRSNWNQEEN